MKIVSTTQSSSAGHDDFASLLTRQSDRQQSQSSLSENRPNGELRTSWKISSSKKRKIDQTNQRKERRDKTSENRRSASKNVFRKLKK
jgi:hypothetical protein